MDPGMHLVTGDALESGLVLGASAVEHADRLSGAQAQNLAGMMGAVLGQLDAGARANPLDVEAGKAHRDGALK
jgi:hypothetical protein